MRSVITLLTLSTISSLAGAADSPAITVWAGAGGYIRDDCVAPVLVLLDNDATQQNGYVSVRFSALGSTVADARRNLELPPNSHKGLFLYVPNMGRSPDRIEVTYYNARGRRVNSVEEKLNTVDSWLPVVAGLGALPGGLPAFETEKGETLYTRLFLDPDRLPSDAIGLEMFDAIILSPPPENPLTRQQVTALHDWTLRGGTLVVDASKRTEAFVQGTLSMLLPFVPERIASLELSELGATETITEGSVENGDEVLFESDGRPLIVRRNYGLGSVTAFAISPDARAMKQWDGREAVWRVILRGLRIGKRGSGPDRLEVPEERMRTDLMSLVRPNQQTGLRLGLVLALTLLYALVVGPGDYFFIKWLGKPKMTWVTFPAIVAVFTVAAWWGAKAWVGGDMTSIHVRRTAVFPDVGAATQFDLMGLFVPAGRRYTIAHADGAPIQQIRSTLATDEAGEYDVDEATIDQRIPIWKSRVYGAIVEPETYPQIDLMLTAGEGFPIATVSNQTDRTLRDNSIVHQRRMWHIPNDIEPGETIEVTLDPDEARESTRLAGINRILFGQVESGDDHWAYDRQLDLRDAMRRGAYVFRADFAGVAKNPLVVDGEVRPESGYEVLLVVKYPRSAP